MKTIQSLSKTLLLFLLVAGSMVSVAQAQTQTKKEKAAEKAAAVKKLVESQNYVFNAQTVIPMGGRSRQITSDYDLRVAKDSVISWLPYFGRAFTAPIDPTKGGIQFTSRDFEYTVTDAKKGGWNIVIKPKDASDVQQMQLNIYENGYAYLQVMSNNRQPISFNGYVTERTDRKKK